MARDQWKDLNYDQTHGQGASKYRKSAYDNWDQDFEQKYVSGTYITSILSSALEMGGFRNKMGDQTKREAVLQQVSFLGLNLIQILQILGNITNTKTSQIREESSSKKPTRTSKQNESPLMCLIGHKQLHRLLWPFSLEARMARSISKTLLG